MSIFNKIVFCLQNRLICVRYICLNTQLHLQNLEYHDRLVKQSYLLYELAYGSEHKEGVSGEKEQRTEEVEFVYLEIIHHLLFITIMQSFILFAGKGKDKNTRKTHG